MKNNAMKNRERDSHKTNCEQPRLPHVKVMLLMLFAFSFLAWPSAAQIAAECLEESPLFGSQDPRVPLVAVENYGLFLN